MPDFETFKLDDMSEVELITALHEDTLSDNPVKACTARALKEIMPVLTRWIEREEQRGTPASELAGAAKDIGISLMMTVICNTTSVRAAADVADLIGNYLPGQMHNISKILREKT